jgi:hypothetical protein
VRLVEDVVSYGFSDIVVYGVLQEGCTSPYVVSSVRQLPSHLIGMLLFHLAVIKCQRLAALRVWNSCATGVTCRSMC